MTIVRGALMSLLVIVSVDCSVNASSRSQCCDNTCVPENNRLRSFPCAYSAVFVKK